jgi:hypothetical protein
VKKDGAGRYSGRARPHTALSVFAVGLPRLSPGILPGSGDNALSAFLNYT